MPASVEGHLNKIDVYYADLLCQKQPNTYCVTARDWITEDKHFLDNNRLIEEPIKHTLSRTNLYKGLRWQSGYYEILCVKYNRLLSFSVVGH